MTRIYTRIEIDYIFRVFKRCSFFNDWSVLIGKSGNLNADDYMSKRNPFDWFDICIRNTKGMDRRFWEVAKTDWDKFLNDLDVSFLMDYLDFYQRIYLTKVWENFYKGNHSNSNNEIKLEFE